VTPPGAGAISYTFDDNGNLTERGSDDFAWDVEDRLTSATVSSITTTFTYNGGGLRDALTTGGNTTTFTWDVNRSIPQVLDDEDLRYVYGIGRIAQVGASTHYYLSDGLGSTLALTDEDGDVANDYDYDVFGGLRDSSGSQDNAFTFAGEQVDGSTGLQYLRARYYDPNTGRFISPDPSGWDSSLGGHRFAFGVNRPTTSVDPSGLDPIEDVYPWLGHLGPVRANAGRPRPNLLHYRFRFHRPEVTMIAPAMPYTTSARRVTAGSPGRSREVGPTLKDVMSLTIASGSSNGVTDPLREERYPSLTSTKYEHESRHKARAGSSRLLSNLHRWDPAGSWNRIQRKASYASSR
jgi:RHS repeat-associated protein